MAKFTSDAQVFPGGVRTNTSMPQFNLGTKVVTPDGRAFRYIKCGTTALVAGKLYDGPADIADHTNLAVAAAADAGALSLTVTLGATAVTENQYAGGVVVINDADGEGFTYTIKKHPTADASASLVITLEDDEPIVTALTTDSEATLVLNQFNGLVVHPVTEVAIPVGVANYQVTGGYYGWIQTRGPVSVLQDASVAGIGLGVSASTTTIGAVTVGTGPLCPIGYQVTAGVSTEYNVTFLTID